jgi:hypothetical protein
MRTTVAEHGAHRYGNEAADDEQELARDNPRRRRDPHDREDDDRHGNGTSRSVLRHGGPHVRND